MYQKVPICDWDEELIARLSNQPEVVIMDTDTTFGDDVLASQCLPLGSTDNLRALFRNADDQTLLTGVGHIIEGSKRLDH